MHLTPVTVGFLVAMPSLSGSLLRIPFAAWVDTTGGRKPFLVLLGISHRRHGRPDGADVRCSIRRA